MKPDTEELLLDLATQVNVDFWADRSVDKSKLIEKFGKQDAPWKTLMNIFNGMKLALDPEFQKNIP